MAHAIAATHSTAMSSTKGTRLSRARANTRPGLQLLLAYPVKIPTVQRQKPESEPVKASNPAPASSPAASPPIAQHELVAAYIREHTKPGDRVFVWGDWPALYVESDRQMASRFPGFLRGFARGSGLPPNNWDTAPDVWPELQADLGRNPPALIVDTAAAGWSDFATYPMRNYPVLQDLVSTRYHLVATVAGVAIYALNP